MLFAATVQLTEGDYSYNHATDNLTLKVTVSNTGGSDVPIQLIPLTVSQFRSMPEFENQTCIGTQGDHADSKLKCMYL